MGVHGAGDGAEPAGRQPAPARLPTDLTIAAIALTGATKIFVNFERAPGRSTTMRYLAAIIAIALPMQLFGFGMALWAGQGGLD